MNILKNIPALRSFCRVMLPVVLALVPVLSLSGCRSHRNTLLNPSLLDLRTIPLPPARIKVAQLVQDRLDAGDAEHIAVYFHALPTGYWFGINEETKFIPASLLKIYLMMGILKEAQTNPGLLREKVLIQKPETFTDYLFPPSPDSNNPPVAGKEYTVEELVSRMVVFSDNLSLFYLSRHIPEDLLAKTMSDFGLTSPDDVSLDVVSVKQQMMAMLALYNSTYLSPEMSQKALAYLARASYDAGLAAGLPQGIKLANKFGERGGDGEKDQVIQLHDCGIIYHPRFPYMLGVMTRGRDLKKLQKVIADISRLVYQEVDSASRGSRDKVIEEK